MATNRKSAPSSAPVAEPIGKFAGIDGVCAICGKKLNPGNTSGIGSTCKGHVGKVRKFYVVAKTLPSAPEFMPITALCDLSVKLGRTRGYAVKLTGGDAGTRAPSHTVFTVYTFVVGGKLRKFVKAEAAQALTTTIQTGKLPA